MQYKPLKPELKPKRKCPACGKEFTANRAWQQFDSKKCQMKYWAATHPRVSLDNLERLRKETPPAAEEP